MRKILFSLLLATTAASPAFAQRMNHDDNDRPRHEERSDRSQARQERVQVREERRADRDERAQPPRQNYANRPVDTDQRADFSRRSVEVQQRVNVNERGRPTLGVRTRSDDSVANWRQRQRDSEQVRNVEQQRQVREQRVRQQGDIAQQRIERRNRLQPPVGARPDRPAPPPQTAYRDHRRTEWRGDWRHDHRYDWRNHRRHHRSIFHLGFYFDPFGWGYHRYNVGWRLWPSYYSSNYWLNDPSMYALPYAPWPYKWVRYYDDALLVDTMSGEVVDVIYDFFW